MRRDELDRPLGLEPPPAKASAGRGFRLAIGFGAAAATLAGLVMLSTHRSGEQADGSAPIVRTVAHRPAMKEPAAKEDALGAAGVSAGIESSSVDIEHGVRVVRGEQAAASHGRFIAVPPSATESENPTGLAPAPDPRLVENGRFGPLPKIAAGGLTPFDAYRRPAPPASGAPRIGIVVTGMGLGRELTRQAEHELPPEVSLAFAPIGSDLWSEAAEARQAGHEILLQTPMEALAGDTGSRWPHELSTEAGEKRNLTNLRWSMAQFAGYVGVMNYLGSKLTSDRAAMTPILREIAGRGLAYVEDGGSAQSLAPAIAADLQMRSIKADVALDASPDARQADAVFANILALARARGVVLAVVPGLPSMLPRLKSFVAEIAAANIELTPVSALISRPPALAASPNQ